MASNSSSDNDVATTTTSVVCVTGVKTKISRGTTVSWIIEDMEDKMRSFPPGKSLKSSIFTIKDTRWYCKLWPNGYDVESKGYISFSLYSDNEEPIEAKLKCNVRKNDSTRFESDDYTMKFNRKCGQMVPEFLSHKIILEKRKQLISCGRVEFVIKISLVEEGTPSPQVSLMESTSEINRLRKLSDNLSSLLLDQNSSDFLIICGDDKFPVHRNLIKARSSFFNGLLSNDFAESNTGYIVIQNMNSDTVKSLIEYIYTGRFKDLESKPIQLLKAADMYDFPLLKKSCEDELISIMNLENVVDMFVLGEDYNAVELRVAAKKMILENKALIVKQDGWHTKLGTLLIELFEAI